MVKVDCASLPATLIESELFGREKGAYTGALTKQAGRFELADGSTLFLDEIGELSLELQAKLLRVLEDGQFERLGSPKTISVDVRVIAATHRDLAEKVKDGTFRQDLYYRLNVFPVQLPPLRERPEDIPSLVWSFVGEFEKQMGKKVDSIPKRVMDLLQNYSWPGNIRELRNVIEQAVIVSNGGQLYLDMPTSAGNIPSPTLKEAERQHIVSVLSKTDWRIKGPAGAARLLGMNSSTLYSAMRRLGIPNRNGKPNIEA
jgi:transcriptional regulator with GAF, ATPase, and Fis domain